MPRKCYLIFWMGPSTYEMLFYMRFNHSDVTLLARYRLIFISNKLFSALFFGIKTMYYTTEYSFPYKMLFYLSNISLIFWNIYVIIICFHWTIPASNLFDSIDASKHARCIKKIKFNYSFVFAFLKVSIKFFFKCYNKSFLAYSNWV